MHHLLLAMLANVQQRANEDCYLQDKACNSATIKSHLNNFMTVKSHNKINNTPHCLVP